MLRISTKVVLYLVFAIAVVALGIGMSALMPPS
jgi:hypothetical protein